MVETFLYYFIKYRDKENKIDLTCKHEHRELNAAMVCLDHYRLSHPRAKLIKKIEIKEWRDEIVNVPGKSRSVSTNDQAFHDNDIQFDQYQENEAVWNEKARADILRRRRQKDGPK